MSRKRLTHRFSYFQSAGRVSGGVGCVECGEERFLSQDRTDLREYFLCPTVFAFLSGLGVIKRSHNIQK